MKKLVYFISLMSLVSCFKSETNPPASKKSEAQILGPVEESTSNPSLGPTENTDPVNPDNIVNDDEVTYYDEEDDTDNSPLPGTPSDKCGVAYKQFNNPSLFFKENGSNTILNLQEFSFDSINFIGDFNFPNTSYNVCIEGYINGSNYYINETNSQAATDNPSKIHQGNYPVELCGHLAYVKNFSGITTLNLKVGAFYYIIHNKNNLNLSSIPTIQSSITPSNSIEACVYSDKAAYKNYEQTFKPQVDAMALDKGALN